MSAGWYSQNRERAAAAHKRWAKRNPEKMRAYVAKWRRKNLKKVRAANLTPQKKASNAAWQKANREKAREYGRRYYAKHRAFVLRRHKEDYDEKAAEKRAAALAYYRAHRDRLNQAAKDRQLVTKYGITRLDFDLLLKAQGGRCANPGCRTKTPGGRGRFHVDHCHRTKRRRGLLCVRCNGTLGLVDDSIAKLEGLIRYLRSYA